MKVYNPVPLKVIYYGTFANAPDLHDISSADGLWHLYKNAPKVLELNNFQRKNKTKKVTHIFYYFLLCLLHTVGSKFLINDF